MAEFILRNRASRDFTVIQNHVLRDDRLKWADRGLLVFMLHLPPNFVLNYPYLTSRAPDGRDAVIAITRRLRQFGYLQVHRERDDTGRYARVIWTVTDSPESGPAPQTGFPSQANPPQGGPTPVVPAPVRSLQANPLLLSTDLEKELKETTTTTTAVSAHSPPSQTARQVAPGGDAMAIEGAAKLVLPERLAECDRVAIAAMLMGFDPAAAQTLLDELAGALETPNTIKTTPIRWFRALTERFRQGKFAPAAGIHIAERRVNEERHRLERARVKQEQAAPTPMTPDERDAIRQRLAAVRSKLIQPKESADTFRSAELHR